jgi:membrane protein implicated in regulation of membrane protease activity
MRLWWKIWGGHVYLALAIIAILVTLGCIATVLLSVDSDVMFTSFVVGLITFLLSVTFGIMASYKVQTRLQRRYIRMDAALALEAVQRVEGATVLPGTDSFSEAHSEAHSAREEGSS